MKVKNIILGVLLVYASTFLGGFVLGLARGSGGLSPQEVMFALMVSNLLFCTAAFCITGIFVKTERLKTLLVVALICWLLSAPNMLLIPTFTLLQWLFSSVFILFTMAVGGGLSYLIAPATSKENGLEAAPPPPPDHL